LMEGIDAVTLTLLGWLSSARLQVQLLLVVLAAMLVAILPLQGMQWIPIEQTTPLQPFFALLWVVGGACAIGVAWRAKYHRPQALLMSGGAGLATVLTFAWLSAPDLALTQLTVEVVTLVLILLGLRWLPRRRAEDEQALLSSARVFSRRTRDFLIAILAGLGMTLLAYAMLTRHHPGGIAS